jgi:hypothetical protein
MGAVSEAELANLVFTGRDGVLLSDSTQLDFLTSKANGSLAESWLMPVSTQAYGAILALRLDRVRSHFEFVDFSDCLKWYREEGLRHARAWLTELGLRFHVEGIDVPEFDTPCQFLLFTHARYVETTVERLIRGNPDIDTFYVVTGRDPLALDFYFDSDVAAAVMRYVCERLGRHVRPIVMERRTRFVFPQFQGRPITDLVTPDQSAPMMAASSGLRAGIAPATIANLEQILDGLRDMCSQIVFFPSTWSAVVPYGVSAQNANEHTCYLSALDDDESAAVRSELEELRAAVNERAARSTLPSCVIRNPYFDFQLDYIVKRRWLSYANMIRRATRFVADHPLDIFILSDHFTAEAAILARLYRRRRTRVLVSLHSGWPCDVNWATWESSDAAVLPSKSAARRIQALSRMDDVHVGGPPVRRIYRSLFHASASPPVSDVKKHLAPRRKIVVLMTNALELNGVPFVDPRRHFETVSRLAQVPPSIQSRLVLTIRTKPQPFGEAPILYGLLCGVPDESLKLLDGLTFTQVLQVADCVVGVNVPTTGYFDVMAAGVPLIHVQTTDVATLHPDLPPQVVGLITDVNDVWPAIESVLFDEDRRELFLEHQRRFITDDLQPDNDDRGKNPIVPFLSGLVRGGNRDRLTSMVDQPNVSDLVRASVLAARMKRYYRRIKQLTRTQAVHTFAGHVDDVLVAPDGCGMVLGWAVDLAVCQPAKALHASFDGKHLGTARPTQPRPDVAAALNDQRVLWSGFKLRVVFDGESEIGTISVCAELHDGTLAELLKAAIDTGTRSP